MTMTEPPTLDHVWNVFNNLADCYADFPLWSLYAAKEPGGPAHRVTSIEAAGPELRLWGDGPITGGGARPTVDDLAGEMTKAQRHHMQPYIPAVFRAAAGLPPQAGQTPGPKLYLYFTGPVTLLAWATPAQLIHADDDRRFLIFSGIPSDWRREPWP